MKPDNIFTRLHREALPGKVRMEISRDHLEPQGRFHLWCKDHGVFIALCGHKGIPSTTEEWRDPLLVLTNACIPCGVVLAEHVTRYRQENSGDA